MKLLDIVESYPNPLPGTPDHRRIVMTLRCAGIGITIVPFIIIYPFFLNYFVAGVTVRGVKD